MKKKLLVIGFVWPEPKSSAAGTRLLQLVGQFLKQDYEVTFVSSAKTSNKTFDLRSIGVSTQSIELNNMSFDDFIRNLNPTIVVFDRFMTEEQYGWRIAENCPNAIRILDTEDFHGLRKARELALKESEICTTKHLQNDITKREIASIYRCDLSLIISEAEINILTKDFKIDKSLLYYLPFLLEPISVEDTIQLPVFEERNHFITIGNFLHAPNYDSILYLKQTIWPLIKTQLPDAQLHIYGAYESQKVTQLHNKNEGFLIKGFAEDVKDVMQNAKVCLAPLRFGAGLKGKLIDAMVNGTPSVMSAIAAEGMFGGMEPNGFVEDTPDVFAQKAVALYIKNQEWTNKQSIGFSIINHRFTSTLFEADFKTRLINLKTNLKTHRQNNFTGQLLMHHTLKSTKYLSKWIEAKNR